MLTELYQRVMRSCEEGQFDENEYWGPKIKFLDTGKKGPVIIAAEELEDEETMPRLSNE